MCVYVCVHVCVYVYVCVCVYVCMYVCVCRYYYHYTKNKILFIRLSASNGRSAETIWPQYTEAVSLAIEQQKLELGDL